MDTKKKRDLDKLLTRYEFETRSKLIFHDPFDWAGVIDYILRHWTGGPLDQEDVRLAIANHIIMRINSLSPPQNQRPLNPPLIPANPSLVQQITANRTNYILNQYFPNLPPLHIPFPVGINYPPTPEFRAVARAPPAVFPPPGVPRPIFFPGQTCVFCMEEITAQQAQHIGITFCSATPNCSARTHKPCFDNMDAEQRRMFLRGGTRCPVNCSMSSTWYAYDFTPAEIAADLAAAAPLAAAAAPPPPPFAFASASAPPLPRLTTREELAEFRQAAAPPEAIRLIHQRRQNIGVFMSLRPRITTQNELVDALTAYRIDYPGDSGITEDEFKQSLKRLGRNLDIEGGKIIHKKYSKYNKHKRSNNKRRSHGKKNKTGKKRLYKRIQTKKRNSGNNGGGRLPVFEKLERGISIPNTEEDRDPNFWLRRGMIDAKSRKIMDNRLDTIDAESRRRQDDQAMSGYDTDTDTD